MCLLKYGDVVKIRKRIGEWLGITPPFASEAWIKSASIENGVVTVDVAVVSAGPGDSFNSYAELMRDQHIVIRDSSRKDWLKIEPMPEFIVWINQNYVSIRKSEEDRDVTDPEFSKPASVIPNTNEDNENSTDKRETADKVKVTDAVHSPISPYLLEAEGIGSPRFVKEEGIVIPLSEDHLPIQYGLASEINSNFFPIKFLYSQKYSFEQYLWKRVVVDGMQRWYSGKLRPIIIVESLTKM